MLNLSGNDIGDKEAQYVAQVLCTNTVRKIFFFPTKYLLLCFNTDIEGAGSYM